jgi:outer membrane protein OmpA-like peptidoglycan-associated protein
VPERVAEAPAPPAATTPRRNFEIIASKCEERLRVGSDFLFDFDRADVRPEAGPTLDEIAAHLGTPWNGRRGPTTGWSGLNT